MSHQRVVFRIGALAVEFADSIVAVTLDAESRWQIRPSASMIADP